MEDVFEGEIEPAALSAICRAAKVLIDLNRLADEEMELIRDEESAAAAAQVAGGFGDPAVLDSAAAIAAWQNQYRTDSLIDQGLVTLESVDTQDANEPPVPVLTAAGRQRFSYQRLTKYTQEKIDDLRNAAGYTKPGGEQLPTVLVELYQMRTTLEEVLTDFAPGSAPVLDALSGQPLSQLPAGVKPATVPVASPEESEQAAKSLQDLLLQANELTREVEVLYEKQSGRLFDIRDELPEEESD